MKKAMVILNPTSGKNKAEDYKTMVTDVLKDEYDEIDVKHTKGPGDGTKFASEACEKSYDLLVSMGGDGTVNEVINGLASHESRPLYGIIPLGTVNDLSKALGISQDVEEAIGMLKSGQTKHIDIGKVNDQYFGNVAAVGSLAEAIHEVSIEEKSTLGSLAYYVEGAKRILEKKTFWAKLTFEEDQWEGEIALILMGLTRSLGAFNRVFPEAKVDDGKLHVIMIKDLSVMETLKLTPDLLAGTLEKSDNVIYKTLKRISIETLSSEEMVSDVDGDEGPSLPIAVEVLPRFLKVLAPSNKENESENEG